MATQVKRKLQLVKLNGTSECFRDSLGNRFEMQSPYKLVSGSVPSFTSHSCTW